MTGMKEQRWAEKTACPADKKILETVRSMDYDRNMYGVAFWAAAPVPLCPARRVLGRSGQPAAASSAPASEAEPSGRKICGSFIQPWLVENWTQERWDTEIQMMAEAGMQYIILQSVVDFTYGDTEQDRGKDPAAYPLKNAGWRYILSSLPELEGVNNGVDSLKECLRPVKIRASGDYRAQCRIIAGGCTAGAFPRRRPEVPTS